MYDFFDNFVLRVPLLSYSHICNLLKSNDLLWSIFTNTQVEEAIYIASPIVHSEIKKMLNGNVQDHKKKEAIRNTFVRYLSRMATRSTPFGLFASCSSGKLGDETIFSLNNSISKITRLDMHYLCTLSQALSKIPEMKRKMKYFPNTSLYPVGKKYRYVEYQYIKNKRKHFISSVERSKYLANLIKIAENGAYIHELISYLLNENIKEENAINFIEELIDSQILEGELTPSVTGDDYFNRIIEVLKPVFDNRSILSSIQEIQSWLNQIDLKPANSMDFYKKIIHNIDQIGIDYEENLLFQTDTVRDTSIVQLGNNVINELYSTICFLNKITFPEKDEVLDKFKEEFYNRYEEKEIPLMEALDPELGIGYPPLSNTGDVSPLIDDFFLPFREGQRSFQINLFQSILQKKIHDCFSQNRQEIIFNDDDVKDFSINWNNLPPTLYAMFQIIRSQSNNVLLLKSCGGSCGANLLGRFAHTDHKIAQLIKEITAKEKELMPDTIIAEIAHLPENRVGNILSRPHIRDYEIVYMAHSDMPRENIIYMSDLYLSIRKGKLFLRSKKLKKEIIPRLTTAHNYLNNTMPVYRFLCDLQTQGLRNGLFLNWGHLGNSLSFRPRVRYKNTILSPASWIVKIEEIKYLFSIKEEVELISQIDQWRENIFLPQYVLLSDGDNELFVDWKNFISIQSLFSIINKRQMIQFSEFLFEFENAPVKDENGEAYLNECIVAFYKKTGK